MKDCLVKIVLVFTFCVIGLSLVKAQNQKAEKPNILIIMVDQQFSDAMSCVMGDRYIHTPNMDLLVEKGMRFTRAYSPNPLCMPMRTSMMTGCFPHTTGVLTNDDKTSLNASKHVFLGKIFQNAGYETGYFGKWHVALKKDEKDIHGFETFDASCELDPGPVSEFIKQKHDKPFLAVASFLSPHEVCQWSRYQDLPGGPIQQMPVLDNLPPLKENYNPPENETNIMTFMRKSYQAHPLFPVGEFTDADWRRLAWGYYRLIERADSLVGEVIKALQESGEEKNTLVVFLADHGDCCGSHHWNQKTVFYDESARVPFVMVYDGKIQKGVTDMLVNTGTDMIPTLCEFAGIEIPEGLPGKSMMNIAEGKTSNPKRDFVVSENHMIQCEPIDGVSLKPQGRMVRSNQFKYCVYNEGVNRESLIDMQFDPLEMVNQAQNPVYRNILEKHREFLREHAKQNDDEVALQMLDNLNLF